MKRLLMLLSAVLLFASCQSLDERIDNLEQRVDNLEFTQLAEIYEQMQSIRQSIVQLKNTDKELTEYIDSLLAATEALEQQADNNTDAIEALKGQLDDSGSFDASEIVAQLEELQTELQGEITSLRSTISTLQSKDSELDVRIDDLEEYVNEELSDNKDWAKATFATLEQYNTLAADVATIKAQIENLNSSLTALESRLNSKIENDINTAVANLEAELAAKVTELTTAYSSAIATAKSDITAAYTAAIATAISNLESSMKSWVNEQLTGYYTIAEVDALIAALQDGNTSDDATISKELEELRESIETLKEEITEEYKSAIEEAVANGGVLDSNDISQINSRIDSEVATLNARIDALEERIKGVEDALDKIKALDITFDIEGGKACMAGTSIEFGYRVTGGDADTAVECFGDGGWSADVVSSSGATGRIKVTAPENGGSGKVVVLVTSGAGGAIMKSLRFDEGQLLDILDRYEIFWDACTLEVKLRTNLDYDVRIADKDKSWLSVADTRALRRETLTFTVAENEANNPERIAVVELVGECNDVLQRFEIVQKYQPSNKAIEFKDKLVEEVCVRNFDLNGDGKLSYKEAARVEIIKRNSESTSFFGDYTKQITSFDELQYFVNLKEVGYYAFAYCNNLTSITLPKGLQTIRYWAFAGCNSLTSITLPEDVTTIEGYAFDDCDSLTSVTLPEGLQTIEDYAFADCTSLTSVTLPEGLQTIGYRAFAGCKSLTSITIPEGVTEIGDNPFIYCSKLQEFKGKYSADGGRALIKDNTFIAFAPACGTTEYTIPNGVTIIGNYAFYYCNSLTSITIPEGVTTIGWGAFYDCYSLTSVTLTEGLQKIGDNAFYSCDNLTTITIPASVTEIGEYNPFERCSKLQEFKGKYSADGGRALINGNTFIAFAPACGTTEYTIPNNVTIIGDDAFYDCDSLASITLPEGLQKIGDWAFFSCNNLTTITIPESVTTIGGCALADCDSLTTITIPESVTEIGYQAFDHSGIMKLYCKPTTPPTISGGNIFRYSGIAGRTIYVPRASVEAYKSAEGWSEYASAIVGYDF